MPEEFTTLDLVAVGIFFGIWLAYQLLFDGRWRRPFAINEMMVALRREWMHRLLARENRIVDSTLVGHTIHSASFFASTTMLLLAGLLGVLGTADRIYGAVSNISLLPGGGQQLFEWKVLLLIGIFIYAFFKFTWALRQFNYFCAVVGSAPDKPADCGDADAYATRMAALLTHAARQLNAGVRAYYFAFAALGWFIHPYALVAATVLMVLVLAYRQLSSPTAAALREHLAGLAAQPASNRPRT